MNRGEVRLGQHRVIGARLGLTGANCVIVEGGVEGEYVHPQTARAPGNRGGDPANPNQAERAALEPINGVGPRRRPLAFPHALVEPAHPARTGQHQRNRLLGHVLAGVGRGIPNRDATRLSRHGVNLVIPHPPADHQAQLWQRVHHRRGHHRLPGDENDFRIAGLGDHVSFCVAVADDELAARLCNGVPLIRIGHERGKRVGLKDLDCHISSPLRHGPTVRQQRITITSRRR